MLRCDDGIARSIARTDGPRDGDPALDLPLHVKVSSGPGIRADDLYRLGMSLLRRMRNLDDAVFGAPPATPDERLAFLRRFSRGAASGTGPGIVAVTVLDLADRLAAAERRITELEARTTQQ